MSGECEACGNHAIECLCNSRAKKGKIPPKKKKMSYIEHTEYKIAKWFRDNGMYNKHPSGEPKGYDQYGNVIQCYCGKDAAWFPANKCDEHYTGKR